MSWHCECWIFDEILPPLRRHNWDSATAVASQLRSGHRCGVIIEIRPPQWRHNWDPATAVESQLRSGHRCGSQLRCHEYEGNVSYNIIPFLYYKLNDLFSLFQHQMIFINDKNNIFFVFVDTNTLLNGHEIIHLQHHRDWNIILFSI